LGNTLRFGWFLSTGKFDATHAAQCMKP
jgi:hypothetical protein